MLTERLAVLREERGYSKKKMAEELSLPYTTYINYEAGTREPGTIFLTQVANYFNVTVDYLLGVTDERKSAQKEPDALIIEAEPDKTIASKLIKLSTPNKYKVEGIIDSYALAEKTGLYIIEPETKYIKMKVYNEPAAAGIGDYLSDYSDTSFELEEFPEDEIPCKASFGIRISGDSMEPTIKNGSVVWVKEQAAIENGEIGIFVLNGESYCKKLYINYENKKIELVSLNPKYKNITVYEDDNLRTIGRVLL